MNSTQEVITRLLRSLGTRTEVEQYLRQFSSLGAKKFAVVVVDGGVLARELDGLASSLTFLAQVGLYPIVVHGAEPQLDEALRSAGLTRPLDARGLDAARRVLQRENFRLCQALEELGTRARPIGSSVFGAHATDGALSGSVDAVHLDAVEAALHAGHLPILSGIGATPSGQIVHVDAEEAAHALALRIEPFKIVLLNEAGGLVDEAGQVISAVNLAEDFTPLMADLGPATPLGRSIERVRTLLEKLPPSSSVSITSPDQLARELFTHRGSGTLLRLGERVVCIEAGDFARIDQDRLRRLLEECFGRALVPGYFDQKSFLRVYLADSYRATAILTREGDHPVPYLDKFAVTQEAQGAGVGGSIWGRMQRDNPKLFWRSRADNPINGWYFDHADGSHKTDRWTVFWYGLDGFDEIRASVERALDMPASLTEHAAS